MVTIVIVSFNTCELLRRCLASLPTDAEVIVVDNASHDGSPEMVRREFPSAVLIKNSINLGFGAANNRGLDIACGELALLLNSDAYAHPGAVERLAQAFEDPGVVAAGGRLLNPDGSLQLSTARELSLEMVFLEQTMLERVLARFPGFRGYWTTAQLPDDRASTVDQVMGACLMMRQDAQGNFERFDERFFLYCEDSDLCVRLRRRGQVVYVPGAEFTHELGQSSRRAAWLGIARYNAGKELYFLLHQGLASEFLCLAMNRFGALLRLTLAVPFVFWPAGRQRIGTFWRVLTAPRGFLREA